MIWNTSFGAPIPPKAFVAIQLLLTFFIGTIAVVLARKALRLSKVPISLLWILYYVIGLAFHLAGWLSGDASAYGFLGPTAIHVYIEGLLCIKTLSKAPNVDSWGRAWTLYFGITTFVSMCLWKPLNVFVLGSILALPADTLTIPAALSVMARSEQPWSKSRTWWLGLTWFWNGPIVAYIFFILVWNAKTENNMVGVGTLLLQLQYVAMGICVVRVFGSMSSSVGLALEEGKQCEDIGVLPTQDQEKAKRTKQDTGLPDWMIVGDLKRGLVLTLVLVGVQFVVSVALPLLVGRMDLDMLYTNACNSFLPGALKC